MIVHTNPTAEAAAVRRAAARAGCRVRTMTIGPTETGPRAIGVVDCPDGWAAARMLLASAIEDARTPGVVAIARELRRHAPSDREYARAVHAFVRAHVAFRRERGEVFQHATHTIGAGYGDCDDHARAVIALALAGGLPADLATLHHGDDAPPDKQGPTHALARICPDRACEWAETTITAGFGEHPIEAATRLGVLGTRRDIAREVRIVGTDDLLWPEKDAYGAEGAAETIGDPTNLAASDALAIGIDISSAQGPNVDFSKVRDAGRSFVIVKLTDGVGTDRDAVANVARAKAAGLKVGAYHFTYFKNEPEAEARHFANVIRKVGGLDLPPALDFEAVVGDTSSPRYMRTPIPEADAVEWARRFGAEMQRQGFAANWLYSYPSYMRQITSAGAALEPLAEIFGLWIADYSKGPKPAAGAIPVVFDPRSQWHQTAWKTWVAWQTHGDDDKGSTPGDPVHAPRIPGVPAAVDHDIFNGTPADLGAPPPRSSGSTLAGTLAAIGIAVGLTAATWYAARTIG